MRALTDALIGSLSDTDAHPRQIVERAALALLTYIEENPEGFQVLVRDSPSTDPTGSFSSLLGDVSSKVEQILVEWFKRQHLPVKSAPYYAQMLVGMTVFTGQYWADRPKLGKEQLAALIVNLAWHGLSRLEAKPELRYEGSKAKRAREAAEKAEQKAEQKAKRANGNSEQPENGDDSADDADKSMAANSAATGHDTSGDRNNDTDNNDPGEDEPAR